MDLWHSIWKRIFLYYHTLRFMRWEQILYKFLFVFKFRLYKIFPSIPRCLSIHRLPEEITPRIRSFSPSQRDTFLLPITALPDSHLLRRQADQVLQGQFEFLNHRVVFQDRVDWHGTSVSHLWRYQLQYFQYARSLGQAYRDTDDRRYYERFKALVSDWIEANPPGTLDGWHPYTISLRVINWMYGYGLFEKCLAQDEAFVKMWLRNLYAQVDFLFHHLEYEAGGNHLLANLKVLLFAGVFFEDRRAEAWLEKGKILLEQELKAQILSDGGHFERSPMYHAIVLQDLIEIKLCLKVRGITVEGLDGHIREMVDFLQSILKPSGHIPLLNDSALNFAEEPQRLIRFVAESGFFEGDVEKGHGEVIYPDASVAHVDSGYFVMRNDQGAYLIADCGRVCPNDLPPHGHADTLSYELSIHGQDWIVDAGVFEYGSGKWRNFFRSTRAHSTVVVDGTDQSEIWGNFRIARRAFPRDIRWISQTDVDYFSGAHDGYMRLKAPVMHGRTILFIKEGLWIILDRLSGKGVHTAESLIHFHPDVDLKTHDNRVVASVGNQIVTVLPFAHQEITSCRGEEGCLQGWYAPEFGIKVPNWALGLKKTGSMPFVYGYLLVVGEVNSWNFDYDLQPATETYHISLNDRQYRVAVDLNKTHIDLICNDHANELLY